MTRCGIIELKSDHAPETERWQQYMDSHRAEVTAVFAEAGIALESFFIARIDEKDYLISYIRIVDEEKAHRAHMEAQDSAKPVTEANERYKEAAWQAVHEATLVFHAEAPVSPPTPA